jgi:hypothetical protein
MCQYLHLPLCGPVPGCFIHKLICSLTLPRNTYSHVTSYNTVYYSLLVKWTVSTFNKFKNNVLPKDSCDMQLHWIQVSHLCLHGLLPGYSSTNNLHQILRRKGERLFCTTVLIEIYEDIGWQHHLILSISCMHHSLHHKVLIWQMNRWHRPLKTFHVTSMYWLYVISVRKITWRLHKKMIEAKTFRAFVRVYSLLKKWVIKSWH